MKAITLTEPWAALVALGAKSIETRSWRTPHYGPIAIHAAKGFPGGAGARSLCMEQPFRRVLLEGGYRLGEDHNLPLGAVVATAYLVTCIRLDGDATVRDVLLLSEARHERDFGDYSVGRYAWVLRDVAALPEPIPARGALGLWEWEPPAGTLYPARKVGAS